MGPAKSLLPRVSLPFISYSSQPKEHGSWALREALGRVNPNTLKMQLGSDVPADAQQILAAAGVRDEYVFPTPVVLEAKPTLVGYYRLLWGVSQKSFYGAGTGMNLFSRMEARGVLTGRQKEALPEFCLAMSEVLAELMR